MPVIDKYEYNLTVATAILGGDYIRIVKDPPGTPLPQNIRIGALLNGGWVPVADTWQYASASTITIPAGGTALYQKGMKVRFKQGAGYKYYSILTVASTLLTVLVNTDYTVANSAITEVAYSFAECPLGWPGWFNFASTVTPSSGSITSYTLTTAKARVSSGKFECIFEISITNNGTGSGNIGCTIGVTPVTILAGTGRNATSGVQLEIYGRNGTGTNLYIVDRDGAYPATTGDVLRFWANCDL